jgi:hypothetical protein
MALLEVGVMYCFFGPLAEVAGETRETISSPWFADGTHGSGREVSFRTSELAPTGWRPVGRA